MNGIRHIRRLARVLAGLAGVLLASAAAFAATNPIPDPPGYIGDPYIGTPPVAPVPVTTVHVVSTGMPGWQITLIAIGAALLAATVAVLLDRGRAARRQPIATAA